MIDVAVLLLALSVAALVFALVLEKGAHQESVRLLEARLHTAHADRVVANDRLWEAQKLISHMLFKRTGVPPMTDPDEDTGTISPPSSLEEWRIEQAEKEALT